MVASHICCAVSETTVVCYRYENCDLGQWRTVLAVCLCSALCNGIRLVLSMNLILFMITFYVVLKVVRQSYIVF